MARIRSIKPELRSSEKVNSWPIEVRYFWVLLWGYCDDFGRGKDNARLIVADAFPLDDSITAEQVDEWLAMLSDAGVIVRYEIAGGRYFYVTNWTEHQKVQHPSKSAIPAPESVSVEPPEILMSVYRETHPRGEGEQGAGSREGEATTVAEPPMFCDKHPTGSRGAPCGPCGDARQVHQIWQKSQKPPPTPIPPRKRAAAQYECPKHPGYPLNPECESCKREAHAA